MTKDGFDLKIHQNYLTVVSMGQVMVGRGCRVMVIL
jgi:hypothetical protein